MGLLSGAIMYLAGPIDNASDDGRGWRQELIDSSADLKIKFIDPTNKPSSCQREVGEEKLLLQSLKRAGHFARVAAFVKEFRREDLRFVDISDALIAYVDPDIHLCGTYDEIFMAERQHKPRFLIIKGGRVRCPNWLFDVFDINDMFDSVAECRKRLIEIDNGQCPMDDEWVLIRHCL
jgi:hypothetical protein